MDIRPMFIAHQMGVLIDELINERLQRDDLFIFNRGGPHGAVAFNCNQHSLLACAFTAFMYNTRLWLGRTANVLFVQFYNALKKLGVGSFRVHHLTNNVAHSPCRWLRNTDQSAKNH